MQLFRLNAVRICQSFLFYRHVKLEAELAEMNWRVKWEDILFGTMEGDRKQKGSNLSIGRVGQYTRYHYTNMPMYMQRVLKDVKKNIFLFVVTVASAVPFGGRKISPYIVHSAIGPLRSPEYSGNSEHNYLYM